MINFLRTLSVIFLASSAPVWADWPEQSAALGARDHPKLSQKYGGAVRNPALSAYVAEVGAAVVAVSSHPDERWTFSVLDSPQVNAFALPGGYVYVTRGLLALANNESELAAVLAHEVIHVIEQHVEDREEANKDALVNGALNALVTGIFGGGENRLNNAVRSGVETAFGQIGAYSKEQEFDADAGGIELLRAAGYRPAAQADFLASMAANATLKAAIAGREYDEASAPFFANHPAPAERQLRALALAGDEGGARNTEVYLAMIDGMIFGHSARGGFVIGQSFVHPELGFTFEAAPGLRVQNGARQINITGPNRSTLVMSGGGDEGSLSDSIRNWVAQIPRSDRQSRQIENLRSVEINGLEATTGTLRMRKRGQRSTLRLTVIRFNGRLIRFAGNVRRGDDDSAVLQWETVQSFQALGEADAAGYQEFHIALHRVEAGESAASISQEMALSDNRENWFRVINGLDEAVEPTSGQLVKLVGR